LVVRIFFDVPSGRDVRDTEGIELKRLEAARVHAGVVIGTMLHHYPSQFWDTQTHRVRVSNSDRLFLLTVEMMFIAAPAQSRI
jgi:hypothetical protein